MDDVIESVFKSVMENVGAGADEATFVDLVLADEEWLRAEFEAIVEAQEWGEPESPGWSAPLAGASPRPERPTPPEGRGVEQPEVRTEPRRPRAAERSPPDPVTLVPLPTP